MSTIYLNKAGKRLLKKREGSFPGSPVVRILHFHCRGHGFLAGELRSHMPSGTAKKKKKSERRENLLCSISKLFIYVNLKIQYETLDQPQK